MMALDLEAKKSPADVSQRGDFQVTCLVLAVYYYRLNFTEP